MMQFTIFGYPQSGKTSLFNLLTGAGITIKSYENQKKEPHLGTAKVPDERLEAISILFPDKEKKPVVIDFVDLAGTAFGISITSALRTGWFTWLEDSTMNRSPIQKAQLMRPEILHPWKKN